MKPLEKIEKLLRLSEKSPLFRQIQEEERADTLATREAAAKKIVELKAERDTALPPLQKTMESMEKKMEAAKQSFQDAETAYRKAKAELWGQSHRFEHSIGKQKAILIESASPELDDAILWFRDRLDELRRPGKISRTAMGSKRNLISWTKEAIELSNRNAVNAAIFFCQNAVRELERMKQDPALDAEKIEKLKSEIPAIDIYEEFSGTKNLEKLGDGSDSARLLKKAAVLGY